MTTKSEDDVRLNILFACRDFSQTLRIVLQQIEKGIALSENDLQKGRLQKRYKQIEGFLEMIDTKAGEIFSEEPPIRSLL